MGTPLNHYAIARELGASLMPCTGARFGHFGLGGVHAQVMGVLRKPAKEGDKWGSRWDALIVRAFEDTRQGFSRDRLLVDLALTQAFNERCRNLGVKAPAAVINRRLMRIAKNPGKYGVTLKRTTRKDPQKPSSAHFYAHAVEFALMRLKYRHGASIDDILIDPDLGAEFEQICSLLAPRWSSMDYRLGALYLRKTRFFSRKDLPDLKVLNVAAIDSEMTSVRGLSNLRLGEIPPTAGLFRLIERAGTPRYLYIAQNENLRTAIKSLTQKRVLKALSNQFWKPDPNSLLVGFLAASEFLGASIRLWELKLIQELAPVFNWPVRGKGG